MKFSRKFFVVAAVLGIAIVGISIDPKILTLILEFDYGKFLSSHISTISLSLLIGIALVVALEESRKGRNRNRDQQPPSRVDPYRSSNPYNK